MIKHNRYDKHTTQGHAFFLYNSSDERLGLIAEYFKQGLAKHELCIFVTPEPQDEVIESFKAVGFDCGEAVVAGSLRIFEMNQTYLPDGRFVADYMLSNVANFMEDAKAHGYSGLRTAGEMSWLDEHPAALSEALDYEERVNSLNSPAPAFTGLCLYPVRDGFSDALHGAVRTHPSFIYNGEVRSNEHYHQED